MPMLLKGIAATWAVDKHDSGWSVPFPNDGLAR